MADPNKAVSFNTEGNYYVDSTCIDCGTCYWIAPEVYQREQGQSCIIKQPEQKEEKKALEALFSCPTNSIGTYKRTELQREVATSFPVVIDSDVHHCGYHSRSSFGAASYFIQREKGNVLIDSPRYLKQLEKKFQELGGIQLQYLTHKDDVADTNEYWEKFKGTRMIHEDDITEKTQNIEQYFQGTEDYQIDEDLLIIPVPGHTKGSTVLLYKNRYLFTGDHLAFSSRLGHLFAFKNHCWYDFSTQIKSMEKLLNYEFEFVLPGHGAPYHASKEEMKEQLKRCIQWMKN
jgi:glyoxylase-like metal-dependent hydrolase (beta-lactamase superfamily II)/ferredoxin